MMNSLELVNCNMITKEGDTANDYQFRLLDDNEQAVNLAGATVRVYIANELNVVLSKDATIKNAGNGLIGFELTKDDVIGNGQLDVEFVVTYPNGDRETFPENCYLKFRVVPNLMSRPNNVLSKNYFEEVMVEIGKIDDAIDEMKQTATEELNEVVNEFNKKIEGSTEEVVANVFGDSFTRWQTEHNSLSGAITENTNKLNVINNEMKDTVTLIDRVNDLPEMAGNMVEVAKVQGNTVQNLCQNEGEYVTPDGYYIQLGTGTTSGDYITITGYATNGEGTEYTYANVITYFNSSLLKPNTTYTVIFRELPYKSNKIVIRDMTNEANLNEDIWKPIENNRKAFTTLEIAPERMAIYYYEVLQGEKARYKNNIILLEGDWTNRTDIPDYFTGIQSVQDSVQIKSIGKNLFDYDYYFNKDGYVKNFYQTSYYGKKFKLKPNTKYTCHCLLDYSEFEDGDWIVLNLWDYTANAKREVCNYRINVSGATICQNETKTITTNSKGEFGLSIYIQDNNFDSLHFIKEIQLEEGTTATEYEPYQETTMQIPLAEPLRSLPNGVCDEITANKITRYIGEVVIDGNASVGSPTLLTSVYRTRILFDKGVSGLRKTISDSLLNIWDYSKDVEHYYVDDSSIWLFISKDKFDGTASGLKAYLAEHPIKICYTLKNPITEDLPIPNDAILQTYQDGHILLENTPVRPKVDINYSVGLKGKIFKLEEELAEVKDVVTLEDFLDYWNK